MKSFQYRLLILVVSCSIAILAEMGNIAVAAETRDPNIIIFSLSHGPESFETKPEGVLKIGVTSFYRIRAITINGRPVQGSGDSVAQIEFPYQLVEGANEFRIVVVSEKGANEKQFTITLGRKPSPVSKPFQLIGIAGVSSLDNVASASEDEKSGAKLSLIVVPQYDLSMGTNATLRFKGILLRERFSEKDFSANEISYTQLFVQWLQKKTALGDVSAGIGMNDIRTNNTNPLLGEDESMVETVFSAELKQKLKADLSWNLKLDLKLRDSKETITSANDDADARETALEAGLDFKAAGLKGNAMAGTSINDAMGDYVDSSTIKTGLRLNYPIDDIIPGLGYDYREKTWKNNNASGVKQKDKTGTLLVKVDYRWAVLPGSQLSLTWKSKKQTSNVSTSEFSASITTLALTVVF
ncbi:MAG: hypothetical protein ABIK68_16280 [bacterium]